MKFKLSTVIGNRSFFNKIKKRRAKVEGHVMRHNDLRTKMFEG